MRNKSKAILVIEKSTQMNSPLFGCVVVDVVINVDALDDEDVDTLVVVVNDVVLDVVPVVVATVAMVTKGISVVVPKQRNKGIGRYNSGIYLLTGKYFHSQRMRWLQVVFLR